MASTNNKLETFFLTVAHLIASGALKRGKDYKLVEESNGKSLYLHIESIYAAYQTEANGAHYSVMDLKKHLSDSPFFVKFLPTKFTWNEPINDTVCRKHIANVCAVMLCYDTLKAKYNIDIERYSIEDFESAILAKGFSVENIDEIKLKGKFVSMVIGYVNNQKHTWNSDGKCFIKNGTPYPFYNLKFE